MQVALKENQCSLGGSMGNMDNLGNQVCSAAHYTQGTVIALYVYYFFVFSGAQLVFLYIISLQIRPLLDSYVEDEETEIQRG